MKLSAITKRNGIYQKCLNASAGSVAPLTKNKKTLPEEVSTKTLSSIILKCKSTTIPNTPKKFWHWGTTCKAVFLWLRRALRGLLRNPGFHNYSPDVSFQLFQGDREIPAHSPGSYATSRAKIPHSLSPSKILQLAVKSSVSDLSQRTKPCLLCPLMVSHCWQGRTLKTLWEPSENKVLSLDKSNTYPLAFLLFQTY